MPINEMVPSLETCKKLKEAGFTQDTEFYWVKTKDGIISLLQKHQISREWNNPDIIAAPLCSELLRELWQIGSVEIACTGSMWNCYQGENKTIGITPPESLAAMYLQSKQNDLLKEGE